MESRQCFHCGDAIVDRNGIIFDQKTFCCTGCKNVYEIFKENDLISYYDIEKNAGASPKHTRDKYNFLNNEKIVDKLLEFKEENLSIISLYIPHIHCSSCIWILENLHKLQDGIVSSQVNFYQKKTRITFDPNKTSVKKIVTLLCKIGYEPYISLDNYQAKKPKTDRSLIYKIGVAFFCFGNIMLLSFPEYFEVQDFWLDKYKFFFRWLIFALALPTFFYSASIYHKAAYHSIKARTFDINIPMSLGLTVMFVRSTIDIVFDYGQGFFDSLASLVFFMLLGKLFQQKTYDFLSFERDFKSYFPLAVTKINLDKSESSVWVYDLKKGDRLLIRNQELIPVDGVLISNATQIDYSFVTGEAVPIGKKYGDKIFAGGKQLGNPIEMEVTDSISQSYLTQLWDNEIFNTKNKQTYTTLITKVSHYFTPTLLIIALVGLGFWLTKDVNKAFDVFTAVLIVACPCALALSTPFTLGNIIRILGNRKFYLKNTTIIEQMAKIDTIVFDKTGTITTNNKTTISYQGRTLTEEEQIGIKSLAHTSNHPLSRKLYDYLPKGKKKNIVDLQEITGKGIQGIVEGKKYKIGSASFVDVSEQENFQTTIYVNIDDKFIGKYVFENEYRDGIIDLFEELGQNYELKILSGDNQGEQEHLKKILPTNTEMIFNQKPEQKLRFIENLQKHGKNVMMIGDGLNDAGALAQSNVGVSVSEDVNIFSPACDGIIDASRLMKIGKFLQLSKKAIITIKMSFSLSLIYNSIGLTFALLGKLSPLMVAVIMPLSTVTIISFVTIMSNYYAKKLK